VKADLKNGGAGSAWAAMLRAGLRLGVTPEAFWRLSLKEWRMITDGKSQPVMGRAEFERLLREHGG
jgi:uncharacterized phage protein (TIGR02216 family)